MSPSASGSERSTQPTLEAVAALAGVSRATVSRVINGSPRVSPLARRAVERAVEELGYVPNRAARSLVTRRTDSVALVVAEPGDRVFSDPFFAAVVRGVSMELARTPLQLVLLMRSSPGERTRLERYLGNGHVDGALFVSLHGADALPGALASRGLPLVVGGRPPESEDLPYVDVDNVAGAQRAVEHLLERGRRRLATITGPLDMAAARDRFTGYLRALSSRGLPCEELAAGGDFEEEGGARAMDRLLEREPDLDGVFAASDLMAAGALRALAGRGRRVPEDVAVVGFDDSVVARTSRPTLTTVRQPVEAMGQEMTRMLLRRLGGGDPGPQRVILETELVVRESG